MVLWALWDVTRERTRIHRKADLDSRMETRYRRTLVERDIIVWQWKARNVFMELESARDDAFDDAKKTASVKCLTVWQQLMRFKC
jgi:hypothetical protein